MIRRVHAEGGDGEDDGIFTDEEGDSDESELDENQKAFQDFLQQRQDEETAFVIDFD